MRMSHLPGAAGEVEGQEEQEQKTNDPKREVQSWRGEQRAGTRRDAKCPQKVARASPESQLPRRPKAPALPARQERASNHLRIDRPRRPGHRPAEHETVYDRRRRDRIHSLGQSYNPHFSFASA